MNIKKYEKIIPWGIIGAILSVIFGIVGLYSGFIYTPKPAIRFEVINETNVLDLMKPVNDLKITFQGEDMIENNNNLKIITVKVMNMGEASILENQYDSRNNWGFRVSGGNIIESRIINSNSEYLKGNISPSVSDGKTVNLEKVIFESGNFITLELLVVHSKEQILEIIPFGKIAGVNKMSVINTFQKSQDEKPILEQVINGNWVIQILKLFVYSVLLLFLLIVIVFCVFGIGTILRKLRMKKIISKLKKNEEIKSHPKIITQMQNWNEDDYQIIQNLIYYKEKLGLFIVKLNEEEQINNNTENVADDNSPLPIMHNFEMDIHTLNYRENLIEVMIFNEFIQFDREKSEVKILKEFERAIHIACIFSKKNEIINKIDRRFFDAL
jgi:hypothetical protein